MRQLTIYGQRRFHEPPLVIWSDGDNCHDLNARYDLQTYAVGFDWQSPARGSLQLALAILALVLEDDRAAMSAHGAFRLHVIDKLRYPGWLLSTEQVLDWFGRWRRAEPNLALGYPYLSSLHGVNQ